MFNMKQTKVFHKNKIVVKNKATGAKWWVTDKGRVFPTNWKLQCYFYAQPVHQAEAQKQIDRKRGKKS
jgi:hypothetical protein